jgi:hypothetical protein
MTDRIDETMLEQVCTPGSEAVSECQIHLRRAR